MSVGRTVGLLNGKVVGPKKSSCWGYERVQHRKTLDRMAETFNEEIPQGMYDGRALRRAIGNDTKRPTNRHKGEQIWTTSVSGAV